MRSLRSRLRPRFAFAALLAVLALVVLGGPAGGVVGFVAFAVFLHACLHSLASEDPETLERLARSGMIMGG
jgi:hypothetical protein